MRGAPQRRQSEGKRVVKSAAAMPLQRETNAPVSESAGAWPAGVVRIGAPLLLKTVLPRPAVATGAPPGRFDFSIALDSAGRNERGTDSNRDEVRWCESLAGPQAQRHSRKALMGLKFRDWPLAISLWLCDLATGLVRCVLPARKSCFFAYPGLTPWAIFCCPSGPGRL